MQLLGNYKSTLSNFQFQELVSLLQTAIQAGEYSGGQTFDQTSLESLQLQGQTFGSLPQPFAGQRATDDSFNNPLGLLSARFSALSYEANSFETQLTNLVTVLQSNTLLIDNLLSAAKLTAWLSTFPNLLGTTFSWDFGIGYGTVAPSTNSSLWTDPLINTTYAASRPLLISSIVNNKVFSGLAANANVIDVPSTNLSWTSDTIGNQSFLYGQDWAELSILSPTQLINYSGVPNVSPLNPYIFTGVSNLGSLPVYVKVGFTPRVNLITVYLENGIPFNVSNYKILTNETFVFQQTLNPLGELPTITEVYNQGTDYTITTEGSLTPINIPFGQAISIQFVEYYPSYQCSLDQIHWSSLLMLDSARPYQDTETEFTPFTFGPNYSFPITDEDDKPTGMFISLPNYPTDREYIITVFSQASQDTVGAAAVLEVDFTNINTMNAIVISPFTQFPLILKEVKTIGQDLAVTSVSSFNVIIDKETTIDFPTTSVSKLYLTFFQQNYTMEQVVNTSPNALRIDIMTQLQAELPSSAKQEYAPQPTISTGYQYDFGLESIKGQYWEPTSGVFTVGPYNIQGTPDIIQLNMDYTDSTVIPLSVNIELSMNAGDNFVTVTSGTGFEIGQTIDDGVGGTYINPGTFVTGINGNILGISTTVITSSPAIAATFSYDSPIDCYLCFNAYDNLGILIETKSNLTGVSFLPNTSMAFPYVVSSDKSSISSVDVYLKFVHRNSFAILERFQLQVVNV